MTRWQYRYVRYVSDVKLFGKANFTVYVDDTKENTTDFVGLLNRLGADGWELAVGSLHIDGVASGAMMFKRPVT